MTDRDLPTGTEDEGKTLDMPEGMKGFAPGQVLGERYQVLEMLGRGGMGEVWHAFDLKLRVEVALKALRPEFFKSERRLELLRQEVRAAREVVSPNVCRIFDLIEVEGRELVSMEYVDGATLLGVLQERGPLELKEAQDIASQFLAGLEAIHKAGLIHRDIKPENIMLTRAGRVVVMDFGLARQETEGGGTVAGTPAYMSPEQAAGQTLDARADVYAAGVVLAEMVSPEGIKSFDSRQSVWEGVRSEPAKVPDTPWAPVIKQAVKRDREGRYNSAHTLTRALEDVTLRVEGADDLHPYPGLASFTESDAEYFFGREAEVEQMWRKLEGPPRMLAIAGPSGAGKTSFLGAGLAPHAPPGWGIVRCTPGNAPVNALAGAFATETAGDSDGVKLLLRFHELDVAVDLVARWRRKHDHALLIIDQFEELFTLNPPEIQSTIAELLNALVLEADIVVLLSMRDDYLFRCHQNKPLRPALADMTMLGPPEGAPLRRALTQPALQCGYRFEDDDLVDEMLAEVEGERGALPLLAFAAARLWERRDKENGLLTRKAYHDIGGVGGALAQHAEATIDRTGVERIPIVRELFRNLITAEGTRAVREWNELLSIFGGSYPRAGINPAPTKTGKAAGEGFIPSRTAAEEVLRELIDARLLTSYEIHEDEHEPTRRVEIIHESLLANWPRLVRWQTQDADAAQLRDQLRQAAKTWSEHDRSDDLLWTGSAYREFAVWRESYPGGLTEIERDFGNAMTSLAGRRRRRRRIAVSAGFAVLLAGLAVVGTFWQRSVRETLRAEAATLLSQAQVELESYPSAAVAYATASLELADSSEARLLALKALWKGPTAFVVNEIPSWEIEFTPDGQWLVQATDAAPYQLHVIGAEGTDELLEDVHDDWVGLTMDTESGVFATSPWGNAELWALWSAPEKKLLSTGRSGIPENTRRIYFDLGRARVLLMSIEDDRFFIDALGFDGSSERLGALPFDSRSTVLCQSAPKGKWFAVGSGQNVYVIEVGDHELSEPRHLDFLDTPVVRLQCDPQGRFVVSLSEDGRIRLRDLDGESPPREIKGGPRGDIRLSISGDGSLFEVITRKNDMVESWIWSLRDREPTLLRHIDLGKSSGTAGWTLNPVEGQIVSILNPDPKTRLWWLRAPADAEPTILQRGDASTPRRVRVHPNGGWLATSFTNGLTLWPVTRPYPAVINRYEERAMNLVFGPEGRWLATSGVDSTGAVRVWDLEGDNVPAARTVFEAGAYPYGLAASPDGEHLLLGTHATGTKLLSLSNEKPVDLPGVAKIVWGAAFSPDGRFAAATGLKGNYEETVVRVWDLSSSEEIAALELAKTNATPFLQFTEGGLVLYSHSSGLFGWDFETGVTEALFEKPVEKFAVGVDSTHALLSEVGNERASLALLGKAVSLDLETGLTNTLKSHGDRVTAVAIDPSGTVAVTGDSNGVIRVGPITGEEPHLLLGNPDEIYAVSVDPLDRWIASSSGTEIRLWPMPDLSKPPLHTLPREDLIAKLKTLTNLRVVRDEESTTGWKLTHDPFPGWETVPTW